MVYVLIFAIVAFVASICINFVFTFNIPCFGNIRTIKFESDLLKTSATPISYTFLIWNLIYAGQIGFIVVESIRYFFLPPPQTIFIFAAISILNGAWVIAFCFEYMMLAFTIISTMAGLVLYQYIILEVSYYAPISAGYFFSIAAPHSIYLAWIIVATGVSLFSFVKYTLPGVNEKARLWSEHSLLFCFINMLGVITTILIVLKGDFVFMGTILFSVLGMYLNGNNNNVLFLFGCFVYFICVAIGIFFYVLKINGTFI